nr:DUF3785 family protein [Clostridium beijerinckii]
MNIRIHLFNKLLGLGKIDDSYIVSLTVCPNCSILLNIYRSMYCLRSFLYNIFTNS